ncbi:MAG TPA: nucleoside triphosphate pyrophosphohydrolase [Candidatus Limnocylindrales bacterium]|nr:nucleoside triphosphate pyrophosphohydrolase [Candidatus Limnocylindrales bacterium]
MTLKIVGLGPAHPEDLTRRAWAALESASVVTLRTKEHPAVSSLPVTGTLHSFDALYEQTADFERIYETIVREVIAAAEAGDVVYAVPGDPLVGESTVTRLLKAAEARGISVEILSGVSFIEPSLRLLGVDALDGLQVFDAIDLAAGHHPPLNPGFPALLGQVYSRSVASELKLMLMNQYPDEFEVVLLHAVGSADESAEHLPLYAIDRSERIGHMTSLYVPALGNMTSFEQFQEIIAHLRAPEGCPWDRKQTHRSLRKYLLEETHEVLEAIDAGDAQALSEELGDLLLQVVLHTQIAIDDGEFRMGDVLSQINHKLIRRHPHVWGATEVENAEQVVTNWEAIKQIELASKPTQRESLLDGVPKGMPALLQAYEYTTKAAKPGFDWERIDDVTAKVREELDEVIKASSAAHTAEEVGDLLFVLVNWARWLGVEPESALREANAKFYRRFHYIETEAAAQGRALESMTLAEMDALWNAAKTNGL